MLTQNCKTYAITAYHRNLKDFKDEAISRIVIIHPNEQLDFITVVYFKAQGTFRHITVQ